MSNQENNDLSLSDLYQSTRSEEPGAALDAAILAQAEEAVTPRRKRPAWLAPVGLAATVILGVNLAVGLKDFSTQPDVYSETAAVPADAQNQVVTSTEKRAQPLDEEIAPAAGLGNATSTPAEMERSFDETAADKARRVVAADIEERASSSAPSQPRAVIATREAPATAPEPKPQPIENSVAAVDSTRIATAPASAGLTPTASTDVNFNDASVVTAPVADPAPEPLSSAVADLSAPPTIAQAERMESDQLQEVVVTGSRVVERDDSPHRRLTAKEQVLRSTERRLEDPPDIELTNTINSESIEQDNAVFVCDRDALELNREVIEDAKIAARATEPPLTVLSWPDFIRLQYAIGREREACAHLEAFRELYPDVVLPEPLPVAPQPEPVP